MLLNEYYAGKTVKVFSNLQVYRLLKFHVSVTIKTVVCVKEVVWDKKH
jgi:hypothetical protein